MDESGSFIGNISFQRPWKKRSKIKWWKEVKGKMAVYFFVSAKGGKVDNPILIWKSRKPRCFKRINAASNLKQVSNFEDGKSWMHIYVTEKVLEKTNYIIELEN